MSFLGEAEARKKRNNRRAMFIINLMLSVFAIVALVAAGWLAHTAYDERAQAGQFLNAPQCAENTATTGDCFAWETQTVSDVNHGKGSTDVYLDGGALDVEYMNVPDWIDTLSAGDSIPVLVWEGSAQALRDPQGQVLYSQESALDDSYNNIAGAAFCSGFVLLYLAYVIAFAPRLRRKGRLFIVLAILLADAAVSIMIGGSLIQSADSVIAGVQDGEIAFLAVGLISAAGVLLARRLRRRPARKLSLGA